MNQESKKSIFGVRCLGNTLAYQQNSVDRLEDLTFLSKGQLRRALEFKHMEFVKLKEEVLRLKRQRTEDLLKINEQQDKIIDLYSRINSDTEHSPLMKAG
jgi:hypothetical protein